MVKKQLRVVKRMYRISLADKNRCTGCMACYAACTQGAIKIDYNDEGFASPQIDAEECIQCGACARVCPEQNPIELETEHTFLAVIAKERIAGSATTGLFGTIARAFIQNDNCYVCGCILDNEQRAVHVLTRDPKIVARMSGSKYVQSDMHAVFAKIRNVLKNGGKVLFGGVPCQCAALLKFCAAYGNQLYVVDLFCHGVGSPLLWKKYLRETAPGVEYCAFRPQDRHERSSWHLLIKQTGKRSRLRYAETDAYLTLYYRGLINRESCYDCRYQTKERCGDLSIGDCADYRSLRAWAKENPVGIVISSTLKGESLLRNVENRFEFKPIDGAKEVKLNTGFYMQGHRPKERDTVGQLMMHIPIRKLKRRYVRTGIKPMMKLVIHRMTTPEQRARMTHIIERLR